MMPEEMMKMMLQGLLPLKFDTKIKIMYPDQEESVIHLKGDVFQSKLKGETEKRIFIALKLGDTP